MFLGPIAKPAIRTVAHPTMDVRRRSSTPVVRRSCDCGADVNRKNGVIAAKLVVGDANDPLEHEADRVAEHVMRSTNSEIVVGDGAPRVARKCTACKEEQPHDVRTKPVAAAGAAVGAAPDIVDDVLRSPGQPLDASTRAFFEPRFGFDFGAVRVHADDRAAHSARALGARAYTVGAQIVFERGAFAPAGAVGRGLLAHELTHVVQQTARPGVVRRQTSMPGPAPLVGSGVLSYDPNTGSLRFTASGPAATPVVSAPTIGLRHDANGSWHMLVGGKDKVVAAEDIPKMLRDAAGQTGATASATPKEFVVPTCAQLRTWSAMERQPTYRTFEKFQSDRNLFHKGLPGSGAPWLELTREFYDDLVGLCIQRSAPLTVPPADDPPPMQDLPGLNLPPGQAIA